MAILSVVSDCSFTPNTLDYRCLYCTVELDRDVELELPRILCYFSSGAVYMFKFPKFILDTGLK